jgi:hypothetical protein
MKREAAVHRHPLLSRGMKKSHGDELAELQNFSAGFLEISVKVQKTDVYFRPVCRRQRNGRRRTERGRIRLRP